MQLLKAIGRLFSSVDRPGRVLRDAPRRSSHEDNPRKDFRYSYFKTIFLEFVEPKGLVGLEIGAFDLPMVEADEGTCHFIDFRTTEELKSMARDNPSHNADWVVPPDFVLPEDGSYEAVPSGYDWVVASHALEHFPDMFGWLAEIGGKLKPGGVLFLILPDRRYTFDVHRADTTFSQLVARHRARLTKPSFEQIFDHRYWHASVSSEEIWAGRAPGEPSRDMAGAVAQAEAGEGAYVDTHCSTFTPESFEALMNDAVRHGIVPFTLRHVRPTLRNMNDFAAVLVRD